MMKKSRLTRLFSLFAALMMCVSMLSAVASASEIQPRLASCPECGGDRYMSNEYEDSYDTSKSVRCTKGVGTHYVATRNRIMLCYSCPNREGVKYATGYYCTGTCKGFVWNRFYN